MFNGKSFTKYSAVVKLIYYCFQLMALLLQPSTIWRKVNKDSSCFILSLPHNIGQFIKLRTSDQQQETRKQTKVENELFQKNLRQRF